MGLPLETLLLIAILVTNIAYFLIHAPLVFLFIKLRRFLVNFLGGFTLVENRKSMFAEMAHGFMRALSERTGSIKGVSARQGQAAGIESLLEGGGGNLLGALGAINKKIDLPVVGKVTPLEALNLFSALKKLVGGEGLNALSAGAASGSNTTAGPLP